MNMSISHLMTMLSDQIRELIIFSGGAPTPGGKGSNQKRMQRNISTELLLSSRNVAKSKQLGQSIGGMDQMNVNSLIHNMD